MRLFIAAPAPESWLPRLAEVQRELEGSFPGYFRWTPRESWHLTVVFLGSQSATNVRSIEHATAVTAKRTPRFELTPTALGAPGQQNRPRLVWLECDDGGVLRDAQQRLLVELRHLKLDTAPFRAHITLGRARAPQRIDFKKAIAVLNRGELPNPAPVDRLILFRSFQEPTGARYEALFEGTLADH